jgi:hypothetical protein
MKIYLNIVGKLSLKLLFYKIILIVFSFSVLNFISSSEINSKEVLAEKKPNFIFYLADDQDKLDYGT